jgi:hypothetical protein
MCHIMQLFRDMVSRFALKSSVCNPQLVFLRSLEVTWGVAVLPVLKHKYLWSDKEGLSDTCQLFTSFPISLVPSVKLITSCLLWITNVSSLAREWIFRFKNRDNPWSFLLCDWCQCSATIYGVILHHFQWWVAFPAASAVEDAHHFLSWQWFIWEVQKVWWGNDAYLTRLSTYVCYPYHCCVHTIELQHKQGINIGLDINTGPGITTMMVYQSSQPPAEEFLVLGIYLQGSPSLF